MEYIISKEIKERINLFLDRTGIDPGVEVDYLTQLVLNNTVYWEKEINQKKVKRLVLVKFHMPVIMREEVYLGNILLNCFLSRQFLLACQEYDLGEIELIGNDVENFYYLWATKATISKLIDCFLKTIEINLPELYFGEQNEKRGVYGSLKKMFSFYKNNFEAFPIFALPEAFVNKLGEIARLHLLQEVKDSNFEKNPTVIIANMSFFLSKEGDENQSPYLLLARTFSRYSLIDEKRVKEAFNLEERYDLTRKEGEKKLKKDIEESLKKQKYSSAGVKKLFIDIINAYSEKAQTDPEEWSVSYCRKKALKLTPDKIVIQLLAGTHVGFHAFVHDEESDESLGDTHCRSCGSGRAMLVDKQIIMGDDVRKFHNHSIRQGGNDGEKICVKCCILAYLINKLTGLAQGSQTQVPKQSSVVFHYGQHDDIEVKSIALSLKKIFALIRERRILQGELYNLQKEKKDIETKLGKVKESKAKEKYVEQLMTKEAEIQSRTFSLQECNEDILDVLNKTQSSLNDPALEIIADAAFTLDSSEYDSAEHYIFGIGLGNYRLIAFILPEIKHRLEKKAHNYIQQRFSNSRVTVLTVLAFLRKICGCDGPWYYLTLPYLSSEGFSKDTFYVRGQKYSAQEVIQHYELFSGFGNDVTKWGPDVLVRKILLTERMIQDPLTVLSDVLRRSSLFDRRDNSDYKIIYDQATRTPDLNAYLYYFKQFQEYRKFKEEDDRCWLRF